MTLLPLIQEDFPEIRDMPLANKVPPATCAGAMAPCEAPVPAQNTGLGPEKTSSFQAFAITTKISRVTNDILSDMQLMEIGGKVGARKTTLLHTLNISHFRLGWSSSRYVTVVASINTVQPGSAWRHRGNSAFPLPGGRPPFVSVCLQFDYPRLQQCPLLSSMGTSRSWLCLWRLIMLSHSLKSSRPSWLIYLHLWLPPPPLLLLLPLRPQPSLKEEKSQRGQARMWGLVSLTKRKNQ